MKSDDKEKKLIQLDKELDGIFEELKETFKKLVFRSMTYRDIHLDMINWY